MATEDEFRRAIDRLEAQRDIVEKARRRAIRDQESVPIKFCKLEAAVHEDYEQIISSGDAVIADIEAKIDYLHDMCGECRRYTEEVRVFVTELQQKGGTDGAQIWMAVSWSYYVNEPGFPQPPYPWIDFTDPTIFVELRTQTGGRLS